MFPGEEQLDLTEYHVPLVFYSPGLIKEPQVISTTASEKWDICGHREPGGTELCRHHIASAICSTADFQTSALPSL